MELLAAVPGQFIVLSCLEDAWEVMVRNNAFDAFKQRTRIFRPIFPMKTGAGAAAQPAARLARPQARVGESLAVRRGFGRPFHRREKQPTPRVLLQRCAEAFEKWDDGLIPAPIALGDRLQELSLADFIPQGMGKGAGEYPPQSASHARAHPRSAAFRGDEGDGPLPNPRMVASRIAHRGVQGRDIPSPAANPRYSAKIDLKSPVKTVPSSWW